MKSLKTLGGVGLAVLALGACGGTQGDPGPAGAQGTPGAVGPKGDLPAGATATVAGIIPRFAVLDREIDVMVIGDNSKFDATTKLDLGPGITVSNVEAASPTLLSARIKIDKAAQIGPRDVKIEGGGGVTPGTKAFRVLAGIDVKIDGTARQGSVVDITVSNNDRDKELANPAFVGGATLFTTRYVSPYEARYTAILDPAGTGPSQLTLANMFFTATGSGSYGTFLSAPDAINVAARAPIALRDGVVQNSTFTAPGDSHFYEFDASAAGVVEYRLSTPQAGNCNTVQPTLFTFGQGGKNADFNLSTSTCSCCGTFAKFSYPVDAGALKTFATVFDNALRGGDAVFQYSLTATRFAPTATVTEQAAAHATPSTAQVSGALNAASVVLINGTLSAANEVDVYDLTSIPAQTCCTTGLEIAVSSPMDSVVVGIVSSATPTTDPAFATTLSCSAAIGPAAQQRHVGRTMCFDGSVRRYLVVRNAIVNQEVSGLGRTLTGKYSISLRTTNQS